MTYFLAIILLSIITITGWGIADFLLSKFPRYRNTVATIVIKFLIALTVLLFIKPLLVAPVVKNDNKTMIVGVSPDFPPFTYVDNDTTVGFDIDLIMEIGRRLNREVVLKSMPFSTLLPTLQLGHIQVIASGLSATPERAQHVLFTTPYLDNNPLVIVSLATAPANSVADLANKEVIVNEGYTADLYLSKIDGISLKRLKAPAEAFLALKSGRAIAFVTAQDTVAPFFDQYGSEGFNVSVIPDTKENACFAIAPQYPELLKDIQKVLDVMQQDGTLQATKTKWKMS